MSAALSMLELLKLTCFIFQSQQGYTDVTVYNAQMVNAQSGHMTVQGIVGQQGPGGNMTAGQHGGMMVQQQAGPAMGQQVMMQQQGVMAQGIMQQHGGCTAMMNTGQDIIQQQQQQQQQQGFVSNAVAQNQLMSPTGSMQAGIVVQGGFVPEGNTVMMAQQNVTMVPSHQGQQQMMGAQQQSVAVQHQYMAQNSNVAVNVMQIQQQPAAGTMQNVQHMHQIQTAQGAVVHGSQMTAVAFSVPQQSQQIQFPASVQNHINTSGAQGVVYSSTAVQYNASQSQQRLQMKSSVRKGGPLPVNYTQGGEPGSGVYIMNTRTVSKEGDAQQQQAQVSIRNNGKRIGSDNLQETKTVVCTMTTASSRTVTTTVMCTGSVSVVNGNYRTNQSNVVGSVSEASQRQQKSPGEQGAYSKQPEKDHQQPCAGQPSTTQASNVGQSQANATSHNPSDTQPLLNQSQAQPVNKVQRTSVAQNYPSLAATLNMTSSSVVTQIPTCMTSSVVTTQASTTAQCAASMSHGMAVSHVGHPVEHGTQRLHHLPVHHYHNPHHHQQHGQHQRPPTPHHHIQSPPGGSGPHPQMHQRPSTPHHLQSPPGAPHHHMQSPPAISPHQMQSPHHVHHSSGPGMPHMMHHQGSPPGPHHPGVPPSHHPGMYPGPHHQAVVPFGPHHPHHGSSGGGPMHNPCLPPHPHHLQHPPQHPAAMNSSQYTQHHSSAAGGQSHHSHTPSPHLTPSPHRTPSPGGSLHHQHPTLAQSLGHHLQHHHPPHQPMHHPPPPPHMSPVQQHLGMHGLRSPPPRMPSPHFNQTHPLNHLNQPEMGSDPRQSRSNPHMCDMQQQQQTLILNQSQQPHGTMPNQGNSVMHGLSSISGRTSGQRPHASEFMDPNARLKAMEEESNSRQPNTLPTNTGPHQQQATGGEQKVTGREHAEQADWQTRTQVISIPVPLGWKRVVEAGIVVYYRYCCIPPLRYARKIDFTAVVKV